MDVQVGVTDLIKLGAKLIGHKIVQYRLSTNDRTHIITRYGRLRGLQRKTVYDEELYYAFEGIPYAKPPVGELRFRAPEPPEAWRHVRDCTQNRAKPLQRHMVLKFVEGDEDCLYLNVYAKKLKSPKPLPVVVWIYGGGFQVGEATRDFYSPDYFMKQDVVLVTINYRLGALGFLSLNDRDLDVPGNAGLKDQVMALRWIKENIDSFNGDPTNITLMGESAGSASTHIMMLTEQTRGLFHKAIMQSGSALCTWANQPRRNFPYQLARRLGYRGSENDKEVFRFLSRAKASEIAAHDNCIDQNDERDYLIFAFGPIIEPYVSEHCVVPKPYLEMMKTAWGNNIPLIIGGNSFEGLFSYQSTRDDPYMLSAFEALLPRGVREVNTPEQIQQMVIDLKRAYFNDEQRASMTLHECLNILSIKHFWHDIYRTIQSRLAYAPSSKLTTYLYRFDFDSPHFNHYRILKCGKNERGVSHADEISYLFYTIASSKLDKSTPEYQTIERMVGLWTAFATYGNPNCKQISPTVWQPLKRQSDDEAHKCLNISEQVEFIELPETKQFKLWNSFYTKDTLY